MDVAVALLVLVVVQLVHLPSLFLFFFAFLSVPSKDINPITKLVLFITYTLQNPNVQIKNQLQKILPLTKEDNKKSENLHENPYVPYPKKKTFTIPKLA